ncbi:hypothetical protein J8L88_16845 [Aquimarina sp. MMG015]|uniref:hypothetical protein n=1 Tax=Aquimarina sp. MMG015 TaxID=2822689 RepID=UPI001B3A4295|nr:hypothetical protein [Aquimarina sp. MMG015]MBQ4804531.1 hypothetical protein [Aquimarina sp. MMG015]
MTEFTPPISERKTEELIEIVYSGKEHWNEKAIRQSKLELEKRNVSKKEQEKVISKWEKEADDYIVELENTLEQNKSEGYSILRMLYIFAVAPFILVGKWTVGKDLIELRNENFKLKFKQRLILLLTGTLFWIGIFVYWFNASEKERLKLSPEEEIEISDWKKKHGYEK